MRVLIIGGMGVIGAEVSRKFVKEGHRPVIFARHRDESLIGDILDQTDIELGDVTDLPSLLHAIKKHQCTHVIHAGGLVSALAHANPPLGVQVNIAGTVNVLEAARLFDIKRVVYTSAKGVYGPFTGEYGHPTFKPIPEDHPKNPTRLYDCLKFMAENACDYYRATYGVDVVSLRFATTYGPGKSARHGTMGVTSRIIEEPFFGRPFQLAKGGDQKDDFIYNKDSALGVYLACVTEKLESHAFNIGTGVGLTLKDFARAVLKHLPDAQMEIGPGLGFFAYPHPMYGVYDISRAERELGYRPQWDLEAAVADYLEALKRMQRQKSAATGA
jgi:UDP-glucose 4-epimerase